jgi:demethylmenaquinone methyltransferase/2-methoxy-6-polyprenyl-1,4-benzoquinol methylase
MQLTLKGAIRQVTGSRYCLEVNDTRVMIDLSKSMLEETCSLIQEEQLEGRTDLHCGDAATLPFEPESVDGIFTSFTLELFDTPELPEALTEWRRVLRPGGRLAVVAISKEGKQGVVMKAYEWTHKHFPNLMDCRPIFVSRAIEAAGFTIQEKKIEHMWVPVEIVLRVTPASDRSPEGPRPYIGPGRRRRPGRL